jgi:hypothetical protein
MERLEHIVPISKKQLALLMNISNSTLRFYLNHEWYEDLKSIGYNKDRKVMSPRQLLYIESKWGELDFSLLHLKQFNQSRQEAV